MTKVLGVALLILGVLAMIFGGFSYTKDRQSADFGPIEIEVEEKERVPVPLWLGAVLVVAGGALLLVPARK
ncbi:MAG: hypothetical protein H0W36_13380 [Gemmatimonadetes bacterium]|jgi:UPF0716 family protein affecting phage T7 exclusion|nr:hypothetical protein [Gemmatimonadota bacterium]